MRSSRRFYVYLTSNGPKPAVLYTGITGNLVQRVWQHKNKRAPGFTSRYNLTWLVYFEQFVYPDAAIAREKEIKGWRRSKRECVILSAAAVQAERRISRAEEPWVNPEM